MLFYNANQNLYSSVMDLHMEVGGALLCMNEFIEIRDSTFTKNMGYLGGAIFFNCKAEKPNVHILITGCYFYKNTGGAFGGAIAFYQKFEALNAKIEKTILESNSAYWGGAIAQLTSTSECILSIEFCNFIKNTAIFSGGIDFSNREGSCFIVNSKFISNTVWKTTIGGGSALKLSGSSKTKVYSSNNEYITNWSYKIGTIGVYSGLWVDNGSYFYGNCAEKGTSFLIVGAGNSSFYNTTIINETVQKAGIFFVKELSLLKLLGVKFENCSSPEKGSIFLISERTTLDIQHSSFFGFRSNGTAILCSYDNFNDITNASLVFINSTFENKIALVALFEISDSFLYLVNCTFDSNSHTLFNLFSSSLSVYNIIINKQSCMNDYGGCLVRGLGKSNIIISAMKAQNVFNWIEGGGIYLEESSLTMNYSSLNDFYSAKEGSSIFSRQSSIMLFQNQFQGYNSNSVKAMLSNLTLFKNKFDNLAFNSSKLPKGFEPIINSALICDACMKFLASNCTFSHNILANQGAAILFLNSQNINLNLSLIYINFSLFQCNKASTEGGAIYVDDLRVTLESNIFLNNKAVSGGAIFYYNKDLSSCFIKLFNNTYIENTADKEGGALKFNKNIGDYTKEIFINNRAIYGSNVATYPIRLKIFLYTRDNKTSVPNSYEDNILTFNNISSGYIFPYIIDVALIDLIGEVVKSIDEDKIEVSYIEEAELQLLNLEGSNRTGVFSTPKPSYIKGGIAQFSEFMLMMKPGNKYFLKLTTNAIKSSTIDESSFSPSEKFLSGEYAHILMIKIKDCIIGEKYLSSYQMCKKCDPGKYSLEVPQKAECLQCPYKAECPGGKEILPVNGFWRSSENSTKIWDCMDFSSKCLGGKSFNNCEKGYSGKFCSVCETLNGTKYSRIGVNQCAACPDLKVNFIRIALVFCAFTVLIYLLVSDYHKEANKLLRTNSSVMVDDWNKYFSIFLKIMINYTQLTSIIAGMDLKWPYYVDTYLKIQLNFGELSVQILSAECMLLDMDLSSNPIYIKTLIGVAIPFVLILVFYLVMLFINIFRKRYTATHFLITFLVVNYLFQPVIIKEIIILLSCENFEEDNTKYLIVNREISCDSDSHLQWVYYLVLPAMIYWVFIFPGSCLFYIIRNKQNLGKPAIMMRISFFLEGYNLKFYYWEFYIMLRKMAIITFSKVLNVSIMTKGTLIIFICLFSTFLTKSKAPFTTPSLNKMELRSNLSSLVIIFSGLFYLSVEDENAKFFMFSVLTLVDFLFFYYWITQVLVMIYFYKRKNIHKTLPVITYLWASWKKASLAVANKGFRSSRIKFLRKITLFKNYFMEYITKAVKIDFDSKGNIPFDVRTSDSNKTRTFINKSIFSKYCSSQNNRKRLFFNSKKKPIHL